MGMSELEAWRAIEFGLENSEVIEDGPAWFCIYGDCCRGLCEAVKTLFYKQQIGPRMVDRMMSRIRMLRPELDMTGRYFWPRTMAGMADRRAAVQSIIREIEMGG